MVLNSSLNSAEAKSCLLRSSERYWEDNYCIFTGKFSQCTVQSKILCSKAAFIFFWILHLLRNTRSHFQLQCLREVGRDWSLFLKQLFFLCDVSRLILSFTSTARTKGRQISGRYIISNQQSTLHITNRDSICAVGSPSTKPVVVCFLGCGSGVFQ